MIGTSDRLCWLAETCKILLLLQKLVPKTGIAYHDFWSCTFWIWPVKHLFPCKCVETNQLNNNLNKKSYDTFLHTEWSPAGVRAFLLRKIQAWCIMAMTVMYNGVQYAPVSCRQSITLPHSTDVLWSVVGKFGKQALWMGSVEGQPIFTQLLVCSAQQLSKPAHLHHV